MANYELGAVVHGEGVVTNLDFHRDGRWCVMSTNESSIHLIDSLAGEEKKKLYAKTNGVGKIRYTHNESCMIMSTDKSNDIQYFCAYDNRYIRTFEGHGEKITSLSMSPTDDHFLSASDDNSICLWHLSSPSSSPIAKLALPRRCERPYATFDESGFVFGVLCYDVPTKKNCIKLFDPRNYDSGPFQNITPDQGLFESAISKTFSLAPHAAGQKFAQAEWSSFSFSTDGNNLLVNTHQDMLYILDSFNEKVEPKVLMGRKNDSGATLGACYSSNSKKIVTGNDDNQVLIYDSATAQLQGALQGHVAPVGCCAWNPKYDVFATGCVNTALWIAKEEGGSGVAE